MKFLSFVNFYNRQIQKLMVAILIVMLISMFIMILGRYIPFIPPFLWTLETVAFGMIWMTFLGASVALREKKHFYLDIVPEKIKERFSLFLYIVYAGSILIFTYVYIVYGFLYFKDWSLVQNSEIMYINMGFVFFSVPLCGLNCLLFFIAELVEKKLGIERQVNNE